MKYKKIYIILSLILIILPKQTLPFESKTIDLAIKKFEQKNSKSSVLIINSRTAKVEYVYNRDFAYSRRFPPGSIAKLWSAVIFIENSAMFDFDRHRHLNCRGKFFAKGKFRFGEIDDITFNLPIDKKTKKRYGKCALRDGHGDVDLEKALVQSCNVYFLTNASNNPEKFYDLLIKKWHLNENANAGLSATGDGTLIISRPKSVFMYISSSIGEGGVIRVSPLKVAQTYAAFFENTPLLVPHEGNTNAKIQYSLNISFSHRDFIKGALSRVHTEGTLKEMSIKNGDINILCAKTGTATHLKKRLTTHGWNVVYFRLKNINYVMVTFVFKGSGMKEAGKLSETVLNLLK
ncbi:penicillin-binding transpeptidase domain-containing protein [Spirochaetota bacterium]